MERLAHQGRITWKWPCGPPNATPRRAAIRAETKMANRSSLPSTAPPTPSPAPGRQRGRSTKPKPLGVHQTPKSAMTRRTQPVPLPLTAPQPLKRPANPPGSAPAMFLPNAIPIVQLPPPAAARTPAPIVQGTSSRHHTPNVVRPPGEGRSAKARQRRSRARQASAVKEDNLMSGSSTDALASIPPIASDRWL